MAHDDRPDNREVENENLRPAGDGEPPRPATEPHGAELHQTKTLTDPATGAPNKEGGSGGHAGTYSQGDEAEGAKRSKFRTDQH